MPDIPLRYIGPLSRFHPLDGEPTRYDLLVLLSGPEPQRSFWESQLLDQLGTFDGRVMLVRGLPGQTELPLAQSHLEMHNHLPTDALNRALGLAELVLSRSGYSTVMDLAILHKKAILVPTPGQPEQQYLARLLSSKQIALQASQQHFDLSATMLAAKTFPFHVLHPADQPSLQEAMQSWSASLHL